MILNCEIVHSDDTKLVLGDTVGPVGPDSGINLRSSVHARPERAITLGALTGAKGGFYE